MFWWIVFFMLLGAGTINGPLAGLLGLGVLLCLFYKLCEVIQQGNDAAHSALDRRDQRNYEEEQIRKHTLERLNANRTKPD
ncbi:hypothetical protein SAMN05660691_04173 [Rheinheimera pacifica]|uniref:Uncharacterized protein n=1 Tax=Rheinheimera pacifica TaxID=173990 RepID=A0A1H6NTE2_9GAMM|nr:hypothetical protein [Rheinheimera pacifica]SEI14163.1 hypothetical protein SAMN05660691_04173 [Rheinheimera pacifica]